jgi:hypothetical protein
MYTLSHPIAHWPPPTSFRYVEGTFVLSLEAEDSEKMDRYGEREIRNP